MAPTTPLSPAERDTKIFMDSIVTTILGTPPTPFRPIDFLHKNPREVPMRVLCLGYSRTGTMNLSIALETLGYRAYHLAEVSQNPTHFPCWKQAQEAKFLGEGKVWGKEEFDQMLGRHDAVLDVPCLNFAEELITMYPDAKVVLSDMPVDGKYPAPLTQPNFRAVERKRQQLTRYVMSWKSWPLLVWADPTLVKPWWDYMRLTSRIIGWTEPARAKANYFEHNATVRRVCPKERLLEFTPGKSGWKELCGFLDKDVPDTPFPKVPDEDFFVGVHIFYLIRVIKAAAKKAALAAVAASMIGAMAWYWGSLWPMKR
ncbi:MAG: hypothetical protein Q9191_007659 [Dirinaria sp. TL-2023a]